MIRTNEAFIFSQLWLIIATRSINDYEQKGLVLIPAINFIPVNSQKTSSTSFPFQQTDEHRLLKERNHRFQQYQPKKETETLVSKQSSDMEKPLIKFPVVTFVQTYASNDTRMIPLESSSTLQKIAFPVLPNSEGHRKRKRKLSNNIGASEEDNDGNKKNEERNNGLNNNAIDVELEFQRKMERTTMKVRKYPPVTKASPSALTTIIPEHVSGPSILVTPIPLPFTPSHLPSHGFDFGIRTTVSYPSHSSSSPSSIIQDQLYSREIIQRPNITELSPIPSFITVLPPVALPIPLSKAETSFNLFDTQLKNSGIGAVISDQRYRNSDSTDSRSTDVTLEKQRQLPEKIPMQMQMPPLEYEPVDDILGCAWDIVTNSCKDLFSLKLCSHCHDFGNIFLHSCKCLVKHTTTF
ncbi:unnamed protein product [Cercopithifilaria johnstoni]|uniref:Uncharacterized protein n=1 Tax=Cercopithifilaria johnstoni TaxID=2874296 RepID=A0A8J2LYM6_9BILA|nr:unnamed protein product [Cercopithifilaria johnstoni]